MGRYTKNTEPISDIQKTDTDTDVGIWNTEKYRIPTENTEKSVPSGILYIHLYHQAVGKKEQKQTEKNKTN